MNLEAVSIDLDAIPSKVKEMKSSGYRFVTITCVEIDENSFEMLYHFDKDLELVNFRTTIEKGKNAPSISEDFFAAFLVENEIIDLFGIKFDGLVLDFGGTLYLDESDDIHRTPFCRYGVNRK
ncbi:MAG: NADH-quinone oxidoreductase subunit C [Deltaproteobacteria bacterium]|nr:NADH-quinone oxidoreductase subunit C [Deltaproteobacteria bacterium]